jgi:hypothetical protein
MIVVGFGSFLLVLVVAYLIVTPALVREPEEATTGSASLRVRKEQLLADIRELDLDLATGKIDEADHRRFRAAALADAAATLHELETAEAREAPADENVSSALGPQLDPVEALIAERKRRLEEHSCPACGSATEPDDAFCRHCGTPLEEEEVAP